MVAAGSITVAVRVRPPTAWEAARLPEPCYDYMMRGEGALSTPGKVVNTATLRDIVQIVDDRILTFDPDEKDRARAFVERGFMPPGTKRYKDKRFMFDRVFNHEARQQDVYEATSQPLLKGLFDGYNATVFAYGATGCGKTHTISGTESDPGIIYLTMADLFQRIEDRRDEWNVEVMVTFLEIYNEEIRDLLAEPGTHVPRGGLSIREDKSVKVVGLVELKPRTAEEVKQIVLQGNLKRTQSPTHANETSSRSHAVLQVHITQSPRTAAVTEQRTMATLSIIDLAGSERAAATSNMGQRMVEGANINKSLLALGNCINALCESGGATRHIPYRNSKLTRLLKFSLGGNCKTVMIVCVAPTSNHFDDTHNTLVYAERATKIKTKVVTRNVVNVDRHVGRYVEAINRLNSEILELKARLSGKRETENDIVRRKKLEATAEVERAKNDMKTKVEQTKASIADGASCTGKITVAKLKLGIIRARLAEIDARGSSSLPSISSDLEAERALLQALAGPEEQVVKPDSAISTLIRHSSNSSSMFEATLRAVSERKSEKLDDVSVDNVKLDAMSRRADMEKLKAESERDEMRKAVEDMAEIMVGLVGMLGRCTVMVGEASNILGEQMDGEGGSGTVQKVAKLLGVVKQNNDETFKKLLGRSTEGYAAQAPAPSTSSLDNFHGYGATFTRRISSGPAILQSSASTRGPTSRRSSAFGGNTLAPPELRRAHRSPRKSLRSSLVSQPYRRVSDKEKRTVKGGKNVQWRDEAGQGDLDDGGPKTVSVAVTIIPASPPNEIPEGATSSSFSAVAAPHRSTSLGGSESEWEDENEKTDDSISQMSISLPPSTYDYPLSSSNNSHFLGTGNSKRSRPSRLDPSFLKSKSKASTLGSLVEANEAGSPERRSHNPLSDMSMNHLSMSDDSSESAGHRTFSESSLHVPKLHDRVHGSPGRRGPSTPKKGLGSSSGTGIGKSGGGRRRSNIGPLRNDKGRRRSSMIPQLSPPIDGSKTLARRVMLASPAKRVKRPSLTKSTSVGTLKLKPIASPPTNSIASFPMAGVDPNASVDISFNRSFRPTWR
ncbi:kinesin-like protein [Collybia nuda]|uniref:Kinesin-like protein n=1 Tax=Collybia nuda TaxID=64659 RepID=A0A9P6CP48_9AGAR|nr:kinesin-like protein [Collybia nuda]